MLLKRPQRLGPVRIFGSGRLLQDDPELREDEPYPVDTMIDHYQHHEHEYHVPEGVLRHAHVERPRRCIRTAAERTPDEEARVSYVRHHIPEYREAGHPLEHVGVSLEV